MIAAIVLGAGLSSRMGEEKLLLPLGNKKVLERTIEGVQDAGFANIIVVTRREVEENIEVYPDVVYLLNNHPERGQASSMAIAMNWLMTHRPDCEGVLFFLGDQPLMDRHLVRRIKKTILANPESIVQPRYQGRQGHPVAFGRPWFKSLSDTQGDLGGRTLIKDNRKSVIEVEGSETCTMDMDTHAEYRVIQHYFYEHNDLRQRLVVVRGAGDLATGTIRRLVQCGYAVVALEVEAPLVIRRTVSFATAITQGETMVEGVCARRCDTLEAVAETLYAGEVAVCVDPQASIVTKLAPRYLVDAILAKKNLGTTMDMAPVVIGLGPGFCAGQDVHAVIETARGHDLGRVNYSGTPKPNSGIPGNIGGYTHERVIHAPAAGALHILCDIGTLVKAGETVADIEGVPVVSKIDGVVRGMIAEGSQVSKGLKIADVDPRGEVSYCLSISDKARNISGGVLEALMHLGKEFRKD